MTFELLNDTILECDNELNQINNINNDINNNADDYLNLNIDVPVNAKQLK